MNLKARVLYLIAVLFPVVDVKNDRDRKSFTRIWHSTWLQEHYYSHPGQPLVEEFARYDPFSRDMLVKFLGIFPIGTFRFIHQNSEVVLPLLKDFTVQRVWQTDRIVEATLLAVPRNSRKFSHLPSLVLMRELVRYCRAKSLEGGVMMADRRMFFTMRDRLGFPIHQIGHERLYEGSVTYPAYIDTNEFLTVMRRKNPFFTS